MYDFVIIGGGLAGLMNAIILGKAGFIKVVLLEKTPTHSKGFAANMFPMKPCLCSRV
jgi:2-polyprenyl-6-methoxyphenol hydroxylase-like FAD-dependent oxidoreductase